MSQPGEKEYNHFVSVLSTPEKKNILVYIPHNETIELFNPMNYNYTAQWFNSEEDEYTDGSVEQNDGLIKVTSPRDGDMVLVLRKID